MENLHPISFQLHLANGLSRTFYQDNPDCIATIFSDLDGRVFTQPILIIQERDEVTAFATHALIGISILTESLPNSFTLRESMSKVVVTQITQESFHVLRHNSMPKVEGRRSNILSEIIFTGGEHLFLEFSEVALGGMGERAELHHLFSNPSLACHKLGGGFSLWNTAQMVSWSHYPKLETPANAWTADEVVAPKVAPATIFSVQ